MTPIPRYPAFRRLEIGDRLDIEAILECFLPYSDFGFTSLWAWDTDKSCAISMLGGNLVVRSKDYTSDVHSWSFIGQDAVVETARTLLAHARLEGLPGRLTLVPGVVIAADDRLPRLFSVAADRKNRDYVNAAEDWASFSKPGFREHLRRLNRCREQAALDFRLLDPGDPLCQDAILGLSHCWARQKSADDDHRDELTALHRFFALTGDDRLAACGFYDRERLAGFSLWEGLPGGEWAVIHFQKADRAYPGLSSWQAHEIGRLLLARGYRLINGQQDLGIAGLRSFKESLLPRGYLEKYVIAERSDRSQ